MTIAEQASNVSSKLRKYESGIVSDPKTVRPSDSTIEQIMRTSRMI